MKNDGCCENYGGHHYGSCYGRHGTCGRHGDARSDHDHRLRVLQMSTGIIVFKKKDIIFC